MPVGNENGLRWIFPKIGSCSLDAMGKSLDTNRFARIFENSLSSASSCLTSCFPSLWKVVMTPFWKKSGMIPSWSEEMRRHKFSAGTSVGDYKIEEMGGSVNAAETPKKDFMNNSGKFIY